MSKPWHFMKPEEALAELNVDPETGLSSEEAARRLSQYGPNEIMVKKKHPVFLLLRQFSNFLIIILLVATVISAALGEIVDAAAIITIVIIMGVMGFIQEYKAEKAVEALKSMAVPYCTVLRNGVLTEIPASQLVPGDILIVKEGDKVPADARIIESVDLLVDESPLTGESTPVEKDSDTVLPPETPVSDRRNMVFRGTYVVGGKGKAVVVSTGSSTEIGRIAKAIAEAKEEKTLLEQELDSFGRKIGLIILGIAAIVFVTSLIEGYLGVIDAFMISVALAVAAIPEGLPAIATALLAIGAYRMAKKKALVRRLGAVETLGAVDVICSDKTGTITKGEMTVKIVKMLGKHCTVEGAGYEPVGKVMCNPGESGDDSFLYEIIAAHTSVDVALTRDSSSWRVKGSPTEGAALVLSYKALGEDGVRKAVEKYPLVKTYPFDRFRKRKTTVHQVGGRYLVVSTGAPELLLEVSTKVWGSGEEELTSSVKEALSAEIEKLASQGFRTFGVAYRWMDDFSEDYDVSQVETGLVFYAVLGIIDPPREEVVEALKTASKAGIKTIMVTGDHKLTAIAVARMIGLEASEETVLEGRQLDKMSDEELAKIVDKINVYARVTPEHKARIVKALKAKGYKVAMTGDGVNDAPALKLADVGVAMGIRGTDVAKEASQLILLDDNYSTIVEAVKEGRIIFDNLKKPINYLLTANMGEVGTVFGAELLYLPPPLRPIHLLWVNVVTDALPAVALGLEPAEPGIMEKSPREYRGGLITRKKILYYVVFGALISGFTILSFTMNLQSLLMAQTAAFTTIVLSEFGRALASRSENKPVWRIRFNRWLIPALATSLLLHLATIYTPLSQVFYTTPLPLTMWIYGLAASLLIWLIDEVRKAVGVKI